VASTKSRKPIGEQDVPRIFDDACIDELATIGRLPTDSNRKSFAEGIREAARIYAREAHTPTDNEVHAEIDALYRAAERKRFVEVAALVETLSPETRKLLSRRATRLCLELPASEVLRGPAQQKACDTVLRLCQHGGKYGKGRLRSSGKRSRAPWHPLLVGPEPRSHFPRRDAERNFIMWLQLAWLEATDEQPSLAADPDRPGPFTRMVAKCLQLVGAGHADAVGLINELNRRRIQSHAVRHQN
jgi:hypothetical protein